MCDELKINRIENIVASPLLSDKSETKKFYNKDKVDFCYNCQELTIAIPKHTGLYHTSYNCSKCGFYLGMDCSV